MASNGGASKATIAGLERARERGFEYAILLDGDDVLAPNAAVHFLEVLQRYKVEAVYSRPNRSATSDLRNQAKTIADDYSVRVLQSPFLSWLWKPRASTALCAKVDHILCDLDGRATIQDHQIAFSIHRSARRVAYSSAHTHHYSMAVAGENLVLDGEQGFRSAVIAYALHYHKAKKSLLGWLYRKRAFSALLKLRYFDTLPDATKAQLGELQKKKPFVSGTTKHQKLMEAARFLLPKPGRTS